VPDRASAHGGPVTNDPEATMPHHRSIAVLVLAVACWLGAACGDDGADAPTSQSQTSAEPETLRLFDFGFEMPATLDGPLIDLAVVNDGAVAHEFAVAQIEPGTTAEEAIDAIFADEESPADFILGDPGGVNLIEPGEELRYQRMLEPGSYVFFCPFPNADGSSHVDHGMVTLFEVTDTNDGPLPTADSTILLGDEAIEPPELEAGTTSYAITNEGTVPHEVYIAGLPSDHPAANRLDELDGEIGAWIEGGQVGTAPLPFHFPGGHQTLPPGETVVLTMTLRPGHVYQFEDFSGDEPITAVASTP
jgi:hypothetical protein